jgi:hypothetical protein
VTHLDEVGFPRTGIENAAHLILAAKNHAVAVEGVVAYFLDVGLSRK